MGKIRTEGIGEVQEFVDIVSSKWGMHAAHVIIIIIRLAITLSPSISIPHKVRLCSWPFENDGWKGSQLGAAGSYHSRR